VKNQSLIIANHEISPGSYRTVERPLASTVAHSDMHLTAHIVHGKQAGPTLFVTAAIHGDELNGVEIVRRLVNLKQLNRIKGTLIAIPIVNVHGFISQSRYLPDGRDLNRSFPGSSRGSLASRMAATLLDEIVSKCTHGIDLHTGARHRENLPQIRADLDNDELKAMAYAFGVPAILNSKIRDGSLRASAVDAGIPVLVYEAGEALRFDEIAIRAGLRGIQNVMRHIGMLPKRRKDDQLKRPVVSANTSWIRAPHSGILRNRVKLGSKVEVKSILGIISDPLGFREDEVLAPDEAMVIGRTNLPLVHEGDALYHLAYYRRQVDAVVNQVESLNELLDPEASGT
jgi:predicted deacylase